MLYAAGHFAGVNPVETQKTIRDQISWKPWWRLRPSRIYLYRLAMHDKRVNGQPISLTDFFGHFIGESLLGDVSKKLFCCLNS